MAYDISHLKLIQSRDVLNNDLLERNLSKNAELNQRNLFTLAFDKTAYLDKIIFKGVLYPPFIADCLQRFCVLWGAEQRLEGCEIVDTSILFSTALQKKRSLKVCKTGGWFYLVTIVAAHSGLLLKHKLRMLFPA